jgi:hypothetical protein
LGFCAGIRSGRRQSGSDWEGDDLGAFINNTTHFLIPV